MTQINKSFSTKFIPSAMLEKATERKINIVSLIVVGLKIKTMTEHLNNTFFP